MGKDVNQKQLSQSQHGNDEKKSAARSRAAAIAIRKKILSHRDYYQDDFKPLVHSKTAEEVRFLEESLSHNCLYECLDDDERVFLIDSMHKESLEKGVTIVTQDDVGDYVYLIEEGNVIRYVDGRKKDVISRGVLFGELSLLNDCPREFTALAKTDVTLWKVSYFNFRHMVCSNELSKRKEAIRVLKKINFLSKIGDSRIDRIYDALMPLKCTGGKRITKKGSADCCFYIIKAGSVKIHDIGFGTDDVCKSVGDYFGELSLITSEPRLADVTTVTDCSLLRLSQEEFIKIVGDCDECTKATIRKDIIMNAPEFTAQNLETQDFDELVHFLDEDFGELETLMPTLIFNLMKLNDSLNDKEKELQMQEEKVKHEINEMKRKMAQDAQAYDINIHESDGAGFDKIIKLKQSDYEVKKKILEEKEKDIALQEHELENKLAVLRLREENIKKIEEEVKQQALEVEKKEKEMKKRGNDLEDHIEFVHQLSTELKQKEAQLDDRKSKLWGQERFMQSVPN